MRPTGRSSAQHMMTDEPMPPNSSGTPEDVLLATGSADPFVYLYNLVGAGGRCSWADGHGAGVALYACSHAQTHTSPHTQSEGSQGQLVQKLEGHTDRVYAVHFHPSERLLASCSADGSVKCWYSAA
jgi:COMPASS component SWD3